MRRLILAALLAGTLAGAAASATTPNVRGTLVRNSATGGCYQGEPCDPPPPAHYVVFTRAGRSTRATIAANGSFAVHLAPGSYTVSEAPPRYVVAPATLRVPRIGMVRPRLVERSR